MVDSYYLGMALRYKRSRVRLTGAICKLYDGHWRCPHYAVTYLRNKNSNIQGSSPNVVIVFFSYYEELLIKERIRSLWEQILSFKRSSHFEKGRNCKESLLDPVVSLQCA